MLSNRSIYHTNRKIQRHLALLGAEVDIAVSLERARAVDLCYVPLETGSEERVQHLGPVINCET